MNDWKQAEDHGDWKDQGSEMRAQALLACLPRGLAFAAGHPNRQHQQATRVGSLTPLPPAFEWLRCVVCVTAPHQCIDAALKS